MKAVNFAKDLMKCFLFPLSCLSIVFLPLAEPNQVQAKPRPALPPVPERCLLSLRFNQTNWWGDLRPAPLAFDNVQVVESWSGYAFHVGLKQSSRLQYPMVAVDEKTGRARTNLDLTVGSLRFWFCPDWSSASLGGTGPGVFGRLIEAGAWTKDATYGCWSLGISEDGDTLFFSAQAGGQEANTLKAPIQFQAGVWHLLTLAYGPKLSELYLDGELAATGEGVTLWPDAKVQAAHGFSIGNDVTGQTSVGGAFDEFTVFGYPLSPEEIARYYANTRPLADLGPISAEEEQQTLAQLLALRALGLQQSTLLASSTTVASGGYSMLQGGTTNFWLLLPVVDLVNSNVSLTICNADTNQAYNILNWPDRGLLPISPSSWLRTRHGTGVPGQTDFTIPMAEFDGDDMAQSFIAEKVSDWDLDGFPNHLDAQPMNPAVSNLVITIQVPATNSIVQ